MWGGGTYVINAGLNPFPMHGILISKTVYKQATPEEIDRAAISLDSHR